MSGIKINTGIVSNSLKIADGRKSFWQWDTGCQIDLLGLSSADELHFWREGLTEPIPQKAYKNGSRTLCDVPDEILQTDGMFEVFVYIIEADGSRTCFAKTFDVKARPKPIEYIYTKTERYTVNEAVAYALNEAMKSGDFKGEKGENGEDGVDGKDGKDGHTPIKGVDYYTEADKAELVADVLNSLPDGDGVSY